MEEDGFLIADKDMADIIQAGDKIGTVMILQNNEVWNDSMGNLQLFWKHFVS